MDLHGKQESSSLPQQLFCTVCDLNFEMMSSEDPLVFKTHRISRLRSQERTDLGIFLTPWPTIPSLFVVLPLRREAVPCCRFPLLWPGLGSFFGCFFGRYSPDDTAWRHVPPVQPASRQTTCCRLGNKLLGAVYTANHPALPTNQAGRRVITERD